ncbi:MAG: tetratricopeptide repeat protein, partial [Roseateles sp.]
ILARMLRNLKEVRRAAQDWTGLLAVRQRLVVLLPDDPVEKRDRGLALAALGANAAAAADLAAYLAARGDAPDAGALRARLATLVERGAPPLQ